MATLYITEFKEVGNDVRRNVLQCPQMPAMAEQTVAIGAGALQSDLFQDVTRYVMIHADVVCHVAFGASPTATTANQRLAANETRVFGVPTNCRLSVIVGS